MEWNVFYFDANSQKIKTYNVLNEGIRKEIKKLKKKYKDSKKEFSEKLETTLRYYYCSKAEWEIILSAWVGGDGSEQTKIDVWNQIHLNWEKFLDYCWDKL